VFRNHHEIVSATLADSEAALLARVADLETERRWFREISIVAIHALHRITRERDHARQYVRELREAQRAESNQDHLRLTA